MVIKIKPIDFFRDRAKFKLRITSDWPLTVELVMKMEGQTIGISRILPFIWPMKLQKGKCLNRV